MYDTRDFLRQFDAKVDTDYPGLLVTLCAHIPFLHEIADRVSAHTLQTVTFMASLLEAEG